MLSFFRKRQKRKGNVREGGKHSVLGAGQLTHEESYSGVHIAPHLKGGGKGFKDEGLDPKRRKKPA